MSHTERNNRYSSDTAVPIKEGDFFNKFVILCKKGEGTFSEVLECRNKTDASEDSVAVKRLKTKYPHVHSANKNREIQAMRRLCNHPNVLKLKEILFEPRSGTLYIILDLMDMNLFQYIRSRKQHIAENRVRFYMLQLIDALRYIHKCGIFHRDVKPENILIKNDTIRLADLGSCRSREAKQPFTEYISTRWYRAPECLLTDGFYDFKMDVWASGCVFFELFRLAPLFPGYNEIDQIDKIHRLLGTPPSEVLSKFKRSRTMSFNFPQRARDQDLLDKLVENLPPDGVDLFKKLLEYDPDARITMEEALHHEYITKLIDKIKKRREEKIAATISPEIVGRTSPARMKNLERVLLRNPRAVSDNTDVHPKKQTNERSPETKKPSPVIEKQLHRTNAELRNTKKIVQNIRTKVETESSGLESQSEPVQRRKYMSKSLNSLTNLNSGAIGITTQSYLSKSPNGTNSSKVQLPQNISVNPNHQLGDLSSRLWEKEKMGGSQSNLNELQRAGLQANLKLPYLSHSLGSLQLGAEKKFGVVDVKFSRYGKYL